MAITDFHLLLFEENASRRASLVEAAGMAGLARLLALGTADEVKDHLNRVVAGATPQERLPTLLLTPLDGPAGLDLLSWMNSRPELRRMVTIGLITPEDGESVGRAYDLRVNSCLIRPADFQGQVDLFQSVRRYWERLNEAPPS
jgi:hypothetical protein